MQTKSAYSIIES